MPVVEEVFTQSPLDAPSAPAWLGEVHVVLRLLAAWGVTDAVRTLVRLQRKDGYTAEDLLILIVAMLCWPSHKKSVGRFVRECHQQRLGPLIAALGGRNHLATQASVSRMLKSVSVANGEAFITGVMPRVGAQLPAWMRPLTGFRDAHGQPLWVVDLDGVVNAFRQRALPQGEELPEPQRRAAGEAGYPGRKRGDIQQSRHRVQWRGSGLWVGQRSTLGNTRMADAVADAVQWLSATVNALGISPGQVVVRMDGAGGNDVCIPVLQRQGFHVLARCVRSTLLMQHKDRLLQPLWVAVEDSKSGPRRMALDLCTHVVEGSALRVVASAFVGSGEKHGAGQMVGRTQFELFITDLCPTAFAAHDLVTLYFNRAGGENDYARLHDAFEVTHTFSNHPPGQDLVEMIAMLVWNVRLVAGALMAHSELTVPLPQPAPRPAPRRVALPEPALLKLAPPPLEPAGTDTAPAPSRTDKALPDLRQLGAAQQAEVQAGLPDGFRLEDGLVSCPAGRQMQLRKVERRADGGHHLVLRATASGCRDCHKRRGCTDSPATTYRREVWPAVHGDLPPAAIAHPTARLAQLPDPPPLSPAPPGTLTADPGPLLPTWPPLRPAALRNAFRSQCLLARVTITREGEAPTRTRRPRFLAMTAAARQNRRRTWEERLDANALPASVTVTIRCEFPETLQRLRLVTANPAA